MEKEKPAHPYPPPREGRNEEMHEEDDRNNEPIPHQKGMEERSWEQRFRGIQQELSHMKEAVKG